MASVKLSNVNKIYAGNVQAVFDFNIDIKDKEFIVFVGPSGCGKSTTLRMIAGLESITSGDVYIDGKLVNNIEPKDRNIAMVFQSYALYPHMTIYENIKFALKLRLASYSIYEDNPELAPLLEKEKELFNQTKKIIKKGKKGALKDEVLEERNALYNELYALIDEINNKSVQKKGIDEYKIYSLEKDIQEAKKKMEYNNSLMLKKPDSKDSLLVQNSELEKMIHNKEEEIEFLKNNEVPLFKTRKPSREEMDIQINRVAEQIDLVPYLFRKPAALSGGQRQRAALGRAMVRNPKVFLMDEPLSNLDAKLRVQTRNEIKKIHQRVGATTIYVTHDQIEAMTMADRIVVMKDGYTQQIGTPEEIFNNPSNKFVAGFIGSSPMNFMKAKYSNKKFIVISDDDKEIVFDAADKFVNKLKDYEGKEIIVGIRPTEVYLDEDPEKEHATKPVTCGKDNVELIGTELVVHTNMNGLTLLVKAKYQDRIYSNDTINICFNTEKLFIFDSETEKRIA